MISNAVPRGLCALGRLASYRVSGAVFFLTLCVAAWSAAKAVGAEPWLPHFAPTPAEETERDRTKVTVRGSETKVYRFDACEPVAGTIDIKEADQNNVRKQWAVTTVPGRTSTDNPACGGNAVTGKVGFSTGGACNTGPPGPWYFSIKGGSFWWGVDNHGKRIDCSDFEPDLNRVEIRATKVDGSNYAHQNTGRPCKWIGELVAQDPTADPPRYRVILDTDPGPCE